MNIPGVRSALDAILGREPVKATPLQESRGDIHEATARRLGIPVLKRTRLVPPKVRPNRADRRRELRADEDARSLRLDTYSRRLTNSKGIDQ